MESEKASGFTFISPWASGRYATAVFVAHFLSRITGINIRSYIGWGIRLKAIVVYLSTSGNTKAMAEAIASGIESKNVDVKAVSFYDVKPEDT